MKATIERTQSLNGKAIALCPYHQEKTPSCAIDVARETFHCFGCGATGMAESSGNGSWEVDNGQ